MAITHICAIERCENEANIEAKWKNGRGAAHSTHLNLYIYENHINNTQIEANRQKRLVASEYEEKENGANVYWNFVI